MSRRLSLGLALLLCWSACSSGNDVVTPPPPPPPGTASAASLTIQTGTAQLGEPGVKVGIRPAVLVKDSSGRALAGVTVAFAVDSGGGSLSSSNAVTGADGVATSGDWTLGPAEGRNVLRASIPSAPGVPVVRLSATALSAVQTLGSSTLPTGGGTATLTKPGSAVSGIQIVVPPAALTVPLTLTVTTSSSATVPHRDGIVGPLTPLITLRSSTGEFAESPVKLRIPVAIPDGTFPVFVRYNPVTQEMIPYTTLSYDATGLTVLFWNFNGANTPTATSSANGAAFSASGSGDVETSGFVGSITTAALMQDFDTGYRPSVNGWEFPVTSTVLGGMSTGMSSTSLWYYASPPLNRPALYRHFAIVPTISRSDRTGIRWAAVVDRHKSQSLYSLARAMVDLDPQGAPTWDENVFRNIRARMAFCLPGRITPQFIALGDSKSARFESWIVWKAVGRDFSVYDTYLPGNDARVVSFPEGKHMTPYANTIFEPKGISVDIAMAVGFIDVVDMGQMNATYAEVLAGTIGNSEWPTYNRMLAWGSDPGQSAPPIDPMYVLDPAHPLISYIECTTCGGDIRGLRIPPGTPRIGGLIRYAKQPAGNWTLLDPDVMEYAEEGLAAPGVQQMGAIVTASSPEGGANNVAGWMDWINYSIKRVPATLNPPTLEVPLGFPFAQFTFESTEMPPTANAEWQWLVGATEKNVTTAPITPALFPDGGPYVVSSIMRDKTTKQPVALATAQVTPAPRPAWILTSFVPSGPFNNLCFPMAWIADHPSDAAVVMHLTGQNGISVNNGMSLEWTKTPGAGITVPYTFDGTKTNAVAISAFPNHTFTGNATSGTLVGEADGLFCPGIWDFVTNTTNDTQHISGSIIVKQFQNGNMVTLGSITFVGTRVVP